MICPCCNKDIAPIPLELKATYQSTSKAIEENIPWIRQVAAQCCVVGSKKAYLSRFALMSNWSWVYKPSKPEKIAALVSKWGENYLEHPTIEVYSLEFTKAELDKVWAWFLDRKELFQKVISTGVPLPKAIALPSGQEWECERCKYTAECIGI